MSSLVRTAISLDRALLAEFDRIIERKGYGSRSEAIRDFVRDLSVKSEIAQNKVIVATLTLLYDHHQHQLSEQLIEAQHHYGGKVLATTHVHLDARNCLEVIILKGRGGDIQSFADRLLSLRGVKHGKLVMTTPGRSDRRGSTRIRDAGSTCRGIPHRQGKVPRHLSGPRPNSRSGFR
jgi:CopG family nickel-responsive transcriptional regulator